MDPKHSVIKGLPCIMVLIFITCAVINHLFFMLLSLFVMHFFLLQMIQALFEVNNFHE